MTENNLQQYGAKIASKYQSWLEPQLSLWPKAVMTTWETFVYFSAIPQELKSFTASIQELRNLEKALNYGWPISPANEDKNKMTNDDQDKIVKDDQNKRTNTSQNKTAYDDQSKTTNNDPIATLNQAIEQQTAIYKKIQEMALAAEQKKPSPPSQLPKPQSKTNLPKETLNELKDKPKPLPRSLSDLPKKEDNSPKSLFGDWNDLLGALQDKPLQNSSLPENQPDKISTEVADLKPIIKPLRRLEHGPDKNTATDSIPKTENPLQESRVSEPMPNEPSAISTPFKGLTELAQRINGGDRGQSEIPTTAQPNDPLNTPLPQPLHSRNTTAFNTEASPEHLEIDDVLEALSDHINKEYKRFYGP